MIAWVGAATRRDVACGSGRDRALARVSCPLPIFGIPPLWDFWGGDGSCLCAPAPSGFGDASYMARHGFLGPWLACVARAPRVARQPPLSLSVHAVRLVFRVRPRGFGRRLCVATGRYPDPVLHALHAGIFSGAVRAAPDAVPASRALGRRPGSSVAWAQDLGRWSGGLGRSGRRPMPTRGQAFERGCWRSKAFERKLTGAGRSQCHRSFEASALASGRQAGAALPPHIDGWDTVSLLSAPLRARPHCAHIAVVHTRLHRTKLGTFQGSGAEILCAPYEPDRRACRPLGPTCRGVSKRQATDAPEYDHGCMQPLTRKVSGHRNTSVQLPLRLHAVGIRQGLRKQALRPGRPTSMARDTVSLLGASGEGGDDSGVQRLQLEAADWESPWCGGQLRPLLSLSLSWRAIGRSPGSATKSGAPPRLGRALLGSALLGPSVSRLRTWSAPLRKSERPSPQTHRRHPIGLLRARQQRWPTGMSGGGSEGTPHEAVGPELSRLDQEVWLGSGSFGFDSTRFDQFGVGCVHKVVRLDRDGATFSHMLPRLDQNRGRLRAEVSARLDRR